MRIAKLCFIGALVSLYSSIGQAQTAPPPPAPQSTYTFGVAFGIVVCTTSTTSSGQAVSCNVAPGYEAPQNATVSFANCATDGNGGNVCQGNWTGSLTADTASFTANVTVSQDVDSAGNVTYDLTAVAADGSQSAVPTMDLIPSGANLTDSGTLAGDSLQSTDGATTYTPVVVVGPALATPSPAPNPTPRPNPQPTPGPSGGVKAAMIKAALKHISRK